MSEEVKDTCKANEIVEGLRSGKKLHDQFGEAFGNRYQIAGKKLDEWKTYFYVRVSPDVSPAECRNLSSQILTFYQEATFYKASAEARLQSIKGSGASSFRKAFANLVTEYKEKGAKLPSKDTLQNLAEEEGRDVQDAIIHGDIEVSFWKSILISLDVSRKIIDTISISHSVEAKIMLADRGGNGRAED